MIFPALLYIRKSLKTWKQIKNNSLILNRSENIDWNLQINDEKEVYGVQLKGQV